MHERRPGSISSIGPRAMWQAAPTRAAASQGAGTMTLRRTLRRGVDVIARMAGILARFQRQMSPGLTVLMYHRVLPDAQALAYPQPALAMPVSAFEQQVQWLTGNCTVRPLRDALRANAHATRPEHPLVALTFDDGYADSAEIIAPILERAQTRGTFFVTCQPIETGELLWYDRAALLWQAQSPRSLLDRARAAGAGLLLDDEPHTLHDWLELLKRCSPPVRAAVIQSAGDDAAAAGNARERYRMMSREQVVDLHRRGHEIGSHTLAHPLLPQLDDRALVEEIAGSSRLLEQWLGERPAGFCYPNGDQDARSVAAVRHAGYAYACTTAPGVNLPHADPLRLLRRDVTGHRVLTASGRHDSTAFAAEVCGFHEGLR